MKKVVATNKREVKIERGRTKEKDCRKSAKTMKRLDRAAAFKEEGEEEKNGGR